jgi:DNA-binding beta-propeller fold protein YncE
MFLNYFLVSLICFCSNLLAEWVAPNPPIKIGDALNGIAITPNGYMALVTEALDSRTYVLVKNEHQWNLLQTIKTNIGEGSMGVGITPDGNTAFIANVSGKSVSVLSNNNGLWNIASHFLITDTKPKKVAVSFDGKTAMVTASGSDRVYVLTYDDTAEIWKVSQTIINNIGDTPSGIAIAPDGNTALVTNTNSASVSVLVKTDGIWSAPKPPLRIRGLEPVAVAITPDGKNALVVNHCLNVGCDSGCVNVLGYFNGTWSLVDTLTTNIGTYPVDIAITPDGQSALVASVLPAGVSVLVNRFGEWSAPNPPIRSHIDEYPSAIAITPNGRMALVTSYKRGSLSVLINQ